jgi:Ran GTPase-activating protein (RanGAP) involved in mRNA processing and transport
MDAVKKITAVLAPHLHDRAIAITNFILLFDSVRVDFEDDPMFAGGPLSDLLNLALVIFQEDEVVFGQVEKVFDKIVAGAVDEDDDEEEEDAEGSDEDNEEINDEEIEDDGDEMEMDM